MTMTDGPRSVRELQSALTGHRRPAAVQQGAPSLTSATALMLGAHPWAGATTVAVGLADAVGALGMGSALVDGAPHQRSGILSATEHELGSGPDGWRRATRRNVCVRRMEMSPLRPSDVLEPDLPAEWAVVVDAGWDLDELRPAGGWLGSLLSTAQLVIVSRASVPAARHAEYWLTTCGREDAVVVLVGERRLPAAVAATLGPALRQVHEAGRVISLPTDKKLAVEGLDGSPLRKPLAATLSRLAAILLPPLGSRTRSRRGLKP